MKVAQVIHSVSREVGGPSVSVPSLCEELGVLGHDVRLHVIKRGQAPDPTQMPHVTVRRHGTLPGGSRLGVSFSMHCALRQEARDCQIFHSHGLWLATNLDAYAVTRRAASRVLISPRGMLAPSALSKNRNAKMLTWRLWQKRAVNAADCLHVTSEGELASVRALGVKRPVCVIPNGVTVPQGTRTIAREGPRRLLFLGRLDPIKGLDYLIDAWQELHSAFPSWELRIVGPSSDGYGERLQAKAREMRLPRLLFAGPAYGEQKAFELAHSDILVLPSQSENFGMVIAEALAAGVPVVCSEGAPWPQLEQRGCGFCVPRGAPPLVECLRVLMRSAPEHLQAMGARGRTWMIEAFAWSAQARKLEQVYDWLHANGARPPTVFLD